MKLRLPWKKKEEKEEEEKDAAEILAEIELKSVRAWIKHFKKRRGEFYAGKREGFKTL